MPRYQFIQPYYEGVPEPTRWEFQFVPVGADGRADFSRVESPVWELLGPEPCSSETVDSWCHRHEVTIAIQELRRLNPSDVEDCAAEQADRCEGVTITQAEGSGWMQVRACGDELSCSRWSPGLPLPESGFAPGLLVGLLGLLLLGGKNARTRTAVRHRDQRTTGHAVGPP